MIRTFTYGAALGMLSLTALTGYLHVPEPRLTNAEIVDTLAIILDGGRIIKNPPIPKEKPVGYTSEFRKEMDNLFLAYGGE